MTLSPNERYFWQLVYVAAIRVGLLPTTAEDRADRAILALRNRL